MNGELGMTGQYPRESVLQSDLHSYYETGWSYLMPDFGNADHYWIEWRSNIAPVYPRVPETQIQESADDSGDRRQQPA